MNTPAPTSTTPTGVVLLHGWTNVRPPGHWQRHVAEAATAAGIEVRYPQLPDTDFPQLQPWLAVAEQELASVPAGHRVLIGHSLGSWAILRLLLAKHDAGEPFPADRVLLVAPPSREVLAANDPIREFGPVHDDAELSAAITASGAVVEIAVSDTDPYFPVGAADWAAALGVTVHRFPDHHHFTLDDGFGHWPFAIDWTFTGSAS